MLMLSFGSAILLSDTTNFIKKVTLCKTNVKSIAESIYFNISASVIYKYKFKNHEPFTLSKN
jgi:hypothetical protein